MKQSGFTLLEVLVALMILTISLFAISRIVSQDIKNTARIDNKMAAHWVAMDVLAQYQIAAKVGNTEMITNQNGEMDMLGQDWFWATSVTQTLESSVWHLEITVGLSQQAGTPLETLQTEIYSYAPQNL